MTITSHSFRHGVNLIAGGRHVLYTGNTGDLQLFNGEALSFRDAMARVGSTFDLAVRLDAVDGFTVMHGGSQWRPEGDASRNPFRIVRDLMRQESLSTFVLIEHAGIMLQDPAQHDVPDRIAVATLLLALTEARTNGVLGNTIVALASSPADVPAVLRSGPSGLALVEIGGPLGVERLHFLRGRVPEMHGVGQLEDADVRELVDTYYRLTDNETLLGVESMVRFSQATRVDATDARYLLHRFRFGETADYWAVVRRDLARIDAQLRASVFGQDRAIDAVVEGLAGAALALNMNGDPFSLESQPRLVLLLLGPTGVGKTELAKAVALVLFGDATAYTRIDMALFAEPHAADRFTGAPPGYVGYEAGGELTEAVRARPFSVILLDEFEKAHPRTHDRLMSVFDEGRVTDAQGRVAYFGESIILMTSNLGSRELAARAAGVDAHAAESHVDLSGLAYDDVADVFERAARDYFVEIGRPEIWGRLAHGAVAFQPLQQENVAQITRKVLAQTSFVHGPVLDVDAASATTFAQALMDEPEVRNLGGRQIRNAFRSAFLRLASWTVLGGHADAGVLRVRFEKNGSMHVSVDGNDEIAIPARRLVGSTPTLTL